MTAKQTFYFFVATILLTSASASDSLLCRLSENPNILSLETHPTPLPGDIIIPPKQDRLIKVSNTVRFGDYDYFFSYYYDSNIMEERERFVRSSFFERIKRFKGRGSIVVERINGDKYALELTKSLIKPNRNIAPWESYTTKVGKFRVGGFDVVDVGEITQYLTLYLGCIPYITFTGSNL